jgi:hypothetical protein
VRPAHPTSKVQIILRIEQTTLASVDDESLCSSSGTAHSDCGARLAQTARLLIGQYMFFF